MYLFVGLFQFQRVIGVCRAVDRELGSDANADLAGKGGRNSSRDV
jgi:hypothetical protein